MLQTSCNGGDSGVHKKTSGSVSEIKKSSNNMCRSKLLYGALDNGYIAGMHVLAIVLGGVMPQYIINVLV